MPMIAHVRCSAFPPTSSPNHSKKVRTPAMRATLRAMTPKAYLPLRSGRTVCSVATHTGRRVAMPIHKKMQMSRAGKGFIEPMIAGAEIGGCVGVEGRGKRSKEAYVEWEAIVGSRGKR